jgi:hypothetical protein
LVTATVNGPTNMRRDRDETKSGGDTDRTEGTKNALDRSTGLHAHRANTPRGDVDEA